MEKTLEPLTFAQIQAARRIHFQSTETAPQPQQEQQFARLHSDSTVSTGNDGVLYQRCGGGRRVLRKKIGSN